MKRNMIVGLAALMVWAGLTALAMAAAHGEGTRVDLPQVPPAARQVLEKEAAQHPLESITLQNHHGAQCYEGKFKDGDQRVELKVAADGRVLERETEKAHQEDQEERGD